MTSRNLAPPLPLEPTRSFQVRWLILGGMLVVALFFGGLVSWAALAPLASAAIAPGTVTVDSNRKTVQHLEGGIIAELLVRNGDRVRPNQVLLRLEDVESRAEFELLHGQRYALLAQEARLVAERDGQDRIVCPPELAEEQANPKVSEILSGQQRILTSRNQVLTGQTAVLEQRIEQYAAEIVSLKAQLASGEVQLRLIAEELKDVGVLFEKGLEKKARLLALKREAARLKGMQGDYQGQITRAQQGIAETRMETLSLRERRDAEAVTELRDVQVDLADVTERLRTAASRLERTEILSPRDGLVMNLRYFTTGGVVEAGAPILDIVPADESLVIEAQLEPINIDEVHAGLAAEIRLKAYKQRVIPTVTGTVTQVSADALSDERTGRNYYTARVEIARPELDRLANIKLYPGMPVEVMIATGERTALDYLLAPVAESFTHAFREQ
jgi:HlyD family type I secretion membrane fusion protein